MAPYIKLNGISEIKAKIRREKNVDVVIIDYLGLISSVGRVENRVQEISQITRSLKLMAKDLNIPLVVCAQLNRSTEGRGKSHRPQLSDLRESGSIEQDADVVMFLYRDDYYKRDQEPTNIAEVIIAKQRMGETGTIKLLWMPQFTKFANYNKEQPNQ